MVSPRTAKQWAAATGTRARPEQPTAPLALHHSPSRTGQQMVKQIVRLRPRHRLGPVQIAGRLGMPASTVHAVLPRPPDRHNRHNRRQDPNCLTAGEPGTRVSDHLAI
jgi:hypothetical protein